MAEAIGAFIVSAALIILVGVTGWFERIMNRIPMEIASALLAGVLAKFGMQAFSAAETNLSLVLIMVLGWQGWNWYETNQTQQARGYYDALERAAAEQGLLLLSCGTRGNVIRFLPPLTIEMEILDEGAAILSRVIDSLA